VFVIVINLIVLLLTIFMIECGLFSLYLKYLVVAALSPQALY